MNQVLTSTTKLVEKLTEFLKPDQILNSEADLRLYDTDATSLFKNQAALVVLPNDTEELAKIVIAINQTNKELRETLPSFSEIQSPKSRKLSFVARGAGTGLSGGAIGNENTVIISIARLNKLLEFDPINRTALIETGIVNSELSKLIKESGLHFSPDPSSQDACTIGGNIAENAGGIHCYKHGVTAEQILGLEVVMPNGEVENFGALATGVRSTNIDLSKLFTGSEGTFGIATKALVKLQPIPEAFLTMQVSFGSVKVAAKTVAAIIREGFKPTAIEMIDHGAIQAVNAAFDLGFASDVEAVLLIELDGDQDEVLLEARQIRQMINDPLRDFNPLKYTETQDPVERKFLWKVRKGTVAAFGQLAPFWYLYDAVVPRSKIPEALEAIEKISKKYRLHLASVMHAADGNLHPNFLYDPDKDPSVIHRIHQASKEIMQLCIDLGGVLSGEHGIGVEKQEHMPLMFSDEDMKTMINVRKIFDPNMISNPNKIFPVRVCKEF